MRFAQLLLYNIINNVKRFRTASVCERHSAIRTRPILLQSSVTRQRGRFVGCVDVQVQSAGATSPVMRSNGRVVESDRHSRPGHGVGGRNGGNFPRGRDTPFDPVVLIHCVLGGPGWTANVGCQLSHLLIELVDCTVENGQWSVESYEHLFAVGLRASHHITLWDIDQLSSRIHSLTGIDRVLEKIPHRRVVVVFGSDDQLCG